MRGDGADELLVDYSGSGTTSRRFTSADERGSIISLTDSSGNLVAINRYDPHGIPQSTNAGRFEYTGQAWLGGANVDYYKARIYLPQLGSFGQTDPIGPQDDANLYAYTGNDPVNLIDPTGTNAVIYGPGGYWVCTATECTWHADASNPIVVSTTPGCGSVSCTRIDNPSGPGSSRVPPTETTGGGGGAAPQKKAPSNRCSGSVRTIGLSGSVVVGLGLNFSVGRATVNSSGAGQWYFSLGFGVGLDLGIAGTASLYNSISSVAGYNDVLSGFVAPLRRSYGGQLAWNVNGKLVGGGFNVSGVDIPGVRAGLSASSTQTVLFGGPCKG